MSANMAHYSPRWQAIAGFEPREHTADWTHWLERVHPEDRPRFETELKALRAGKSKRMRNEHRLQRPARPVAVGSSARGGRTWRSEDGETGEVRGSRDR